MFSNGIAQMQINGQVIASKVAYLTNIVHLILINIKCETNYYGKS